MLTRRKPIRRRPSTETLAQTRWGFPRSVARTLSMCAALLLAVLPAFGCAAEPETTPPLDQERPPAMSEVEWGGWLFSAHGYVACHSVAGVDGVGPALDRVAMSERTLADGTTTIADESYLRAAILEPDAHRVAGYEATMPLADLDYAEADAVVRWLQELAGVAASEEAR